MLMTNQIKSERRQLPTQPGSAPYLQQSKNYAPSTNATSNIVELGSKRQMNPYPTNSSFWTRDQWPFRVVPTESQKHLGAARALLHSPNTISQWSNKWATISPLMLNAYFIRPSHLLSLQDPWNPLDGLGQR